MSSAESSGVEPAGDDEHATGPLPIEIPVAVERPPDNVDLKTQIIRFVVVGAGSGALDFGLTMLLQYAFGVTPGWAKACGFLLGTTTAYLINRRWTFSAEPSFVRMAAVMALYAVTFFVNVGVYAYLSHLWPENGLYSLIAYVIAQGLATVINFVVQRRVIFRMR